MCVAPYVFNSNWVSTLSFRKQVGESRFHGAISDCLDDGRYSRAPLLKEWKISSNLVVVESCAKKMYASLLHYHYDHNGYVRKKGTYLGGRSGAY